MKHRLALGTAASRIARDAASVPPVGVLRQCVRRTSGLSITHTWSARSVTTVLFSYRRDPDPATLAGETDGRLEMRCLEGLPCRAQGFVADLRRRIKGRPACPVLDGASGKGESGFAELPIPVESRTWSSRDLKADHISRGQVMGEDTEGGVQQRRGAGFSGSEQGASAKRPP